MQARDVMAAPAIAVTADTPVRRIAALLLEHRISAVPVITEDGRLSGIVSEGDLIRRAESGPLRERSWWLRLLADEDEQARDYLKTHGKRASEVMTANVLSVEENTAIADIAALLEKHRVKRVPVMHGGKVVGIVSRANLLHALAAMPAPPPTRLEERELRERVLTELRNAGLEGTSVNAVVSSGVVELWGAASSEAKLKAARLAVRNAAPSHRVEDHLTALPAPASRLTMWE